MVEKMGSQNPDNLLRADVSVAGKEFDPCGLVLESSDGSGIFAERCPEDMHHDR